ncbi:MAG: hypothetical protein KC591_13595, partial [Gemmatimonadetes bacterium]|nr:hypothetical protein [Gemmatimonadota bacterium]
MIERVVDNRVFLLTLDELYRDAMKRHERTELLACARRVTEALDVSPVRVPIEGYYAEDAALTEYFLRVRALQKVDERVRPKVESLPEFQRLLKVTSSPLYGRVQFQGYLLPVGCDPLTQATTDTRPWRVETLTAAACEAARKYDDYSLVGLAALSKDPVLIAATRESVVLYAEALCTAPQGTGPPRYVWRVDEALASQARRFVETFNRLFREKLPRPDAAHAADYWSERDDDRILGRCVRIAMNDSRPDSHYHWGICRCAPHGLIVHDFWDSEVWTTDRYRGTLKGGRWC